MPASRGFDLGAAGRTKLSWRHVQPDAGLQQPPEPATQPKLQALPAGRPKPPAGRPKPPAGRRHPWSSC